MKKSSYLTSQLWLCLSLIAKRRPSFWLTLLDHYDLTIETLFKLPSAKLFSLGLTEAEVKAINSPELLTCRVKDWLDANRDCQLVGIDDGLYPEQLMQLDSPPLVLFCRGNAKLLKASQVAIVGSRKSTIQGANNARQFARELGDKGFTVTSGLALGIDGAAHQGAYATIGGTIAVLGGGLDQLHPKSHLSLAQKITQHSGCIISEFAPWVTVKPYHFPRRNRIIAGLSKGVLLVESKIKSGSMITANLAAELGRDVFAIPGNIHNPLSEGPHWLIQQGAKLTTNVDDILHEYPGLHTSEPQTENDLNIAPVSEPATQTLMNLLHGDVTSIDNLSEMSSLSVSEVMTHLLKLELNGYVKPIPGGYMRVK